MTTEEKEIVSKFLSAIFDEYLDALEDIGLETEFEFIGELFQDLYDKNCSVAETYNYGDTAIDLFLNEKNR